MGVGVGRNGGREEGMKEVGEGGREGGRHWVAVTVSPGLDEQVLSGAQTSPHSPLCVSLPVLDHEMLGGRMKEFNLF